MNIAKINCSSYPYTGIQAAKEIIKPKTFSCYSPSFSSNKNRICEKQSSQGLIRKSLDVFKNLTGIKSGSSKSAMTAPTKISDAVSSETILPKEVNKAVGKHKIPRYIYHLTTQENYENMLKTGSIQIHTSGSDTAAGEAIFATELTNLFKNWGSTAGDLHDDNILEKLFKKVGDSEHPNVIMLKIPTDKLDADSLFIRSQYDYFLNCQSIKKSQRIFEEQLPQRLRTSSLLKGYSGDGSLDSMLKYIQTDSPEFKKIVQAIWANEHNMSKQIRSKLEEAEIIPAAQSKLFEQKGHAIEYIYKKPIPIDIVETSNIVDTSKLRKIFSQLYENQSTTSPELKQEIYSIFQKMFAGMPEINAVEHSLKKHYL